MTDVIGPMTDGREQAPLSKVVMVLIQYILYLYIHLSLLSKEVLVFIQHILYLNTVYLGLIGSTSGYIWALAKQMVRSLLKV